ncbi:MAG: SDR family oxidoreductase [Steroidobacteraceae bacterium]|jgi:3-oxoacyl-[acyl-carrier protein] reductase|nr:SDR family oxidoreductase [Steroidobacteraceae bacterium]
MHVYPSLRGRVVLVTGAGRGFGRLMSLALAEQGAQVLGTSARNRAELDATGAEVEAAARAAGRGGRFVGMLADVSREADCEATAARAIQEFGRIDALVNNAARGPTEADANYYLALPKFWTAPPQAFRRMVETNLIGAFLMARAVVPGMIERGFGRIVNLSTSHPTMVMQGLAAYGATKAGLEAATVMWAKDLAGTGVTANVLLPGGPADTALIGGTGVGTRAQAGFRAGKGPTGDEGRIGGILPAEVIVPPTLWLCADESAAFNGRRIVGKDWDPEAPPEVALAKAMQPQGVAPRIM